MVLSLRRWLPRPEPDDILVYMSSFTVTYSTQIGSAGYILNASTASDYSGTVISSSTKMHAWSTHAAGFFKSEYHVRRLGGDISAGSTNYAHNCDQ